VRFLVIDYPTIEIIRGMNMISPTTIENMLASRTAPAEASLTTLIMLLYSSSILSQRISIAVLKSSAIKTKNAVPSTIRSSIREIFKKIERLIATRKTKI
jgi:hypothetical protein